MTMPDVLTIEEAMRLASACKQNNTPGMKFPQFPNVPSENKTIQSSMSNMSFNEIVKDANIRKSAMVTSLIERAKEKLKNKGQRLCMQQK